MRTILILLGFVCALGATPVHAETTPSTSDLEATVGALSAHVQFLTKGYTTPAPLSVSALSTIVQNGTRWMLTAQEPTGHFGYEYLPYRDRYRSDDNMVRQAGALYMLGEVYRHTEHPDEDLSRGIKSAIRYFTDISERNTKENFSCIRNSTNSSTCKLGTTALALTGILGYVEAAPLDRATYRTTIDEYLSYILASQRTDGGFREVYRIDDGFLPAESPYANGEALLALVRAYQYSADGDVKDAIDRAYQHLRTKAEYEVPLHLWMMAALKDMQRLWPNEDYVQYARDFTNWRIAGVPATTHHNFCPYIEGVVSAYSVIATKPLPGELVLLRNEIDRRNAMHSELQLDQANLYRVLTTNGSVSVGKLIEPKRAFGGFLTGYHEPTERIDFTQHCVSAYLQTLVDIDGKKL